MKTDRDWCRLRRTPGENNYGQRELPAYKKKVFFLFQLLLFCAELMPPTRLERGVLYFSKVFWKISDFLECTIFLEYVIMTCKIYQKMNKPFLKKTINHSNKLKNNLWKGERCV